MTLSRKHYEKIAAVIRTRADAMAANSLEGGAMEQVRQLAEDLAGYFQSDNARFRRALFLEACGMGEAVA